MRRHLKQINIFLFAVILCFILSGCSVRLNLPDQSANATEQPTTQTTPSPTVPVATAKPVESPAVTDVIATPETPQPAKTETENLPQQTETKPNIPESFVLDEIVRTPHENGERLVVTYRGQVTDDAPELIFTIEGYTEPDWYLYNAEKLTVTLAKTGEQMTSYARDTICGFENLGFMLADVNFDGYRDIMLMQDFGGAHGHLSYVAMLWDDSANTFSEPVESFADILNPVINTEYEVIRSRAADSAFCDYYSIYRYSNGEFYLDLQLVYEQNEKVVTITEYQYTNGMPQLVSTLEAVAGSENNHTPDSERYFGKDSLWRLDDPIWLQSAHFQ